MHRISFKWVRYDRGCTAEEVAREYNKGSRRKTWKWHRRALRGYGQEWGSVETLKIDVATLRGKSIEMMQLALQHKLNVDCVVQVLINGREPLAHAVWQDGQIRERDKRVKKLEETLRFVGRE